MSVSNGLKNATHIHQMHSIVVHCKENECRDQCHKIVNKYGRMKTKHCDNEDSINSSLYVQHQNAQNMNDNHNGNLQYKEGRV